MSTPTTPDGTASAVSCDLSGQVSQTAPPAQPPGLLTMRAALVLFGALVAGGAVAVLTYLSANNSAAAALAGLMGAGASTIALHGLIGH